MVDSVPELVKRHAGSPQRRRSSSATTIEPSVGAAKCVPSAIRSLTAAAMTGFACPTHITPNPLWKSVYWLPSTSQTDAPDPCDRYVGHGSLFWNWEGTPPGMTAEARAKNSPDRAVRARSRARSRSIRSATRVDAGSVVAMRQHLLGGTARAYSRRRRNLVRISRLCGSRSSGRGSAGSRRRSRCSASTTCSSSTARTTSAARGCSTTTRARRATSRATCTRSRSSSAATGRGCARRATRSSPTSASSPPSTASSPR